MEDKETIGVVVVSLLSLSILCFGFYKLLSYVAGPVLSNDQIIQEVKKCEEAGLKANTLHSNISFRVTFVQCEPKP